MSGTATDTVGGPTGMQMCRIMVMTHMTRTTSRSGQEDAPASTVFTNHAATPVPTRPVASACTPMIIMMISHGMFL